MVQWGHVRNLSHKLCVSVLYQLQCGIYICIVVSWSPKGKQLAIGLQSGDIISFSPTEPGNPKMFLPKSPAANNQSIVHTTWLSTPTLYAILAPPGPLEPQTDQAHMVTNHDTKRNVATDISIPLSFFPSGLRRPGAFTVVLRNWDPAKFLVIVGDSSTADIGILGCVATTSSEDQWHRLSFEDTATPSMPLDTDAQETVMVG